MEDIVVNKITWKFVKPLKNKFAVEEFLKEKRIELPDGLVECIRDNNGGRPSVFLFDTNKRNEYVFQSLFSYNYGDKCNIYDIFPNFEKTKYFPIGLEAAGNIICYEMDNRNYVLWNHETAEIEIIINLE